MERLYSEEEAYLETRLFNYSALLNVELKQLEDQTCIQGYMCVCV
jgi:hypothetical protein